MWSMNCSAYALTARCNKDKILWRGFDTLRIGMVSAYQNAEKINYVSKNVKNTKIIMYFNAKI